MSDTQRVVDLIREVAATIIAPRFRHLIDDQVDAKAGGEVVTVVDRESEAALADQLRAWFPDALVTGEEGIAADPGLMAALDDHPHTWLIDPLDGTANFVAGNPDFGVLVVQARSGRPQRSFIWQPLHERFLVADRAAGTVTCNGARLEPLASRPPTRRGYAAAPFVGALPGRVETMLGSCAIDYPEILLGHSDFLVHDGRRAWDHWPGALAMGLLGGVVRLADGSIPTAAGPGALPLIAARSQSVWDAVAAAVRGGPTEP